MDAKLTPYTIADFCAAMDRKEITVNYEYQRSPKVWPPAAKSFLIETILLGYPMPKLSLHQITDVKTRKTQKEIVDGQQRSMTILDFYHNKLRLSRKSVPEEAAGHTYDELEAELKHKFLDYALSVDLFIGATKEDIREVFRRMNSYTVPLNAEEKRHAKWQGDFKWFNYRLSKKYSQAFEDMGAFTEKQLNRMADVKLFSEVIHALTNGITTTKENDLGKLYEKYDKKFPEEEEVKAKIDAAMNAIIEREALHNGPLMKSHQLYAYMLAVIHAKFKVPAFDEAYKFSKGKVSESTKVENLTRLAGAIEDPDSDRKLEKFVDAGSEKTNVAEQRKIRFLWFCRALADDLP